MTTWLKNKNKPELIKLTKEVGGIEGTSNTLKPKLVDILDAKLKGNEATYASNPLLAEYYTSPRANSPVKREPSAGAPGALTTSTDAKTPPQKTSRARKSTNVAPEAAAGSSNNAGSFLPNSTPRSIQNVASKVPLPSSPQAVSSFVDRTSARVSRRVTAFWESFGVLDTLDNVRVRASTSQGIASAAAFIEAAALVYALLPVSYPVTFSVPDVAQSIIPKNTVSVPFPNFFVLLEYLFWAPWITWFTLTLAVPGAVGWIFNFTRAVGVSRKHAYPVDPLAFSLAKLLVVWVVLDQAWGTPWLVAPRTAGKLEGALCGGVASLEVAGAIGVVTGLYEAVLRRS
ncbi:MAG: hypothetical protein M1831_000322 [Alyxoria varia]|nr:MAG: hypothetical protein M1831_000322 [Alyxoria varia]